MSLEVSNNNNLCLQDRLRKSCQSSMGITRCLCSVGCMYGGTPRSGTEIVASVHGDHMHTGAENKGHVAER